MRLRRSHKLDTACFVELCLGERFVVSRLWAASVKCSAHDHTWQNSTLGWQNPLQAFARRKGVKAVACSSA
jgi:hypothetical protein